MFKSGGAVTVVTGHRLPSWSATERLDLILFFIQETVTLKIRLHCDGCIDRIKRRISKIKGEVSFESAAVLFPSHPIPRESSKGCELFSSIKI